MTLMMFSFYQLLWLFVIYSFIGWIIEVIYYCVDTGSFVNRGFLNGPSCPVYGIGVIGVLMLLTPIRSNLPLLFIGSLLLTTVVEFFTGFVLERFFNEKWWDYNDEPFNIMGYVCLKFSLLWGMGCLLVVHVFNPLVMKLLYAIPQPAGEIILIPILLGFLVDTYVTVSVLLKMKQRLTLLEELASELKLASDGIGGKLSGGVLSAMEKADGYKRRADELKAKYMELAGKSFYSYKRIMKAFPKLQKSRYKELIEKIKNKIDF